MGSLYVCLFSTGHIKVGRSSKPVLRIRQHADRVSCLGVSIVNSHVVQCDHDTSLSELALIKHCEANATSKHSKEWFGGLNFDEVCTAANEVAKQKFEVVREPIKRRYRKAVEHDFAPNIRYEFISTDAGWADNEPDKPHWPESAVSRWDLRDDWHLIWPELVSHPCAVLFAPSHPQRIGPPNFSDWVDSWPDGFIPPADWADIWPELKKKAVA